MNKRQVIRANVRGDLCEQELVNKGQVLRANANRGDIGEQALVNKGHMWRVNARGFHC